MKNERNNGGLYFCIGLFIALLVLAKILKMGIFLQIVLGIPLFIIAIIAGLAIDTSIEFKKKKLKNEEENLKKEEEKLKKKAVRFYITCKERGILYPVLDNQINELRIIAQECCINIDCRTMYDIGYKEYKTKLCYEDKKILNETEKKLELLGGSKYIQGLSELFAKSNKYYGSVTSIANKHLESKTNVQARTRSWAIAGGIAEGIGGTGIGIMTAMDVQRENMLAEQKARETREKAYNAIQSISNNSEKVKDEIKKVVAKFKKFEEKISKLKKATIEPDHYNIDSFHIRETGTISLRISPKSLSRNCRNVLDGIIYVGVKNNNFVVGEGYIFFPGYLDNFDKEYTLKMINSIGIDNFITKEVICFPINGYSFKTNETYEFEFGAVDVWEIDTDTLKSSYEELCDTYMDYKFEMRKAALSAVADALTT